MVRENGVIRGVVRAAKRFFGWLLEDLKDLLIASRPVLPEDKIPVDKKGKPDLSFYTEPLGYYIDLYTAFLNTRWKGSTREQQMLAWKQRVHGTWGLSTKGQEALPFLITLLRHKNPDAREDAAFLLGELKLEAGIAEQLLACLQTEQDPVAKSATMEALGKLRYRPAIPALAAMILDKETDNDTRLSAIDSLGSIVGQDFSGPDKLQQAEKWLTTQPSDMGQR